MLVREMVEKCLCCMKFLQEILKLDEEPSNEGFISLTNNWCAVQYFHIPKEERDPRCFNVHVYVEKVFVGEALCDPEANVIRPCFMNIGLVDGNETIPVGMVRDMMIDIEGFKFKINVIVSKNKKEQEWPLILGRSFLAIVKALIDLKQKEVFIMSNGYYQCYKVNPSSSNAYNEDIKVADN